ncbi:unnamed protein product [Gongylonema pulchrum]|uniref:Uncharacterized protein n=1 Tax=Gongylonema pulchrum TaxID=637853 RepID=A0A183EZD2_9BILA|nr:unnamed protein product [Gongylonema pulchrum]
MTQHCLDNKEGKCVKLAKLQREAVQATEGQTTACCDGQFGGAGPEQLTQLGKTNTAVTSGFGCNPTAIGDHNYCPKNLLENDD